MELIQQFDLLAGSLGGVAKLRELILSLAVRGKLVPQDPADESASVLLQKIRTKKERLITKGTIKRDKPIAEIAEDEQPFALPVGWSWQRLGNLGTIGSSSRVHQKDWTTSGVPFYRAREIVQLSKNDSVVNDLFITEDLFISLSANGLTPAPNDIMITGVGTIGVPYIVKSNDRFYFKDASVLIFKNSFSLNAKYLTLFLKSPDWVSMIHANSMGTTVHTLTIGRAADTTIPLPPLPEQSRIVAKVDELMALCDRLEAEQGLAARVQGHWVEAALAQLADSADADEFARHWQHLAQHFDTLFTTPDSITQLEATLLQLAVRGKLVPQDPNDEPASTLLQKIRTEKDRLIAEGKIKKDKPLPPISDEEKPFALPEGWKWTRFGEVADISSGVTLGRKTPLKTPISLPYLRVANVQRWRLNLAEIKEILIDDSEIDRFRLLDGDLLITEGGDWDKVGRTCIWRSQLNTCLHQNHVFKARRINTDWQPRWAELFLNSVDARTYFASAAKQTTNLASINMTQLKSCPFPLPPLPEQSDIVAKLEALLALTARLKTQLAKAQQAQALLADVLLETSI